MAYAKNPGSKPKTKKTRKNPVRALRNKLTDIKTTKVFKKELKSKGKKSIVRQKKK